MWPDAAQFGLFLSHDVDQVHDRELWRVLADLNHVRRMADRTRNPATCAWRGAGSARALVSPKPAVRDFETILDIEARHGFRSTFFLLHDRYWARHGARYRFSDLEIQEVASLIRAAGCEIGLHGGYYRFNDAAAYRESREAIQRAFSVEAVGIRNHMLRFSGPETWRAQHAAGFAYDATFGKQDSPGPLEGMMKPFWAVQPSPEGDAGLVELPLTVMDGTLFRHCRLTGAAALDAAWAAIEPVIEDGGLVTLLWHNNYFNEPEYADWQWVYESLLERLAEHRPWCATGAEIAAWWRTQPTAANGRQS